MPSVASTDSDDAQSSTTFDLIVSSTPALVGDLPGDGFVDFQDLTILLAQWDRNVSAGLGNLVDPLTSPVNFQDLTLLLAAWTGPGPAAAPRPAASEATSERDAPTTERRIATNAFFDRLGQRDRATPRRTIRFDSLSSPATPLSRLHTSAVDRAMGEDSVRDRGRLTRRHAHSSV